MGHARLNGWITAGSACRHDAGPRPCRMMEHHPAGSLSAPADIGGWKGCLDHEKGCSGVAADDGRGDACLGCTFAPIEVGRASCRGTVVPTGEISGVAGFY